MPHLVQMHNELGKDGVATVSVNMDDNDGKPALEARVSKILQNLHADFTALMLAPGQDATDWLDNKLKAPDGLPAQQIFDRQGKLDKTFSGGGHEAEISKRVAELLKQK